MRKFFSVSPIFLTFLIFFIFLAGAVDAASSSKISGTLKLRGRVRGTCYVHVAQGDGVSDSQDLKIRVEPNATIPFKIKGRCDSKDAKLNATLNISIGKGLIEPQSNKEINFSINLRQKGSEVSPKIMNYTNQWSIPAENGGWDIDGKMTVDSLPENLSYGTYETTLQASIQTNS